jgi:hypothetical protein
MPCEGACRQVPLPRLALQLRRQGLLHGLPDRRGRTGSPIDYVTALAACRMEALDAPEPTLVVTNANQSASMESANLPTGAPPPRGSSPQERSAQCDAGTAFAARIGNPVAAVFRLRRQRRSDACEIVYDCLD